MPIITTSLIHCDQLYNRCTSCLHRIKWSSPCLVHVDVKKTVIVKRFAKLEGKETLFSRLYTCTTGSSTKDGFIQGAKTTFKLCRLSCSSTLQ